MVPLLPLSLIRNIELFQAYPQPSYPFYDMDDGYFNSQINESKRHVVLFNIIPKLPRYWAHNTIPKIIRKDGYFPSKKIWTVEKRVFTSPWMSNIIIIIADIGDGQRRRRKSKDLFNFTLLSLKYHLDVFKVITIIIIIWWFLPVLMVMQSYNHSMVSWTVGGLKS